MARPPPRIIRRLYTTGSLESRERGVSLLHSIVHPKLVYSRCCLKTRFVPIRCQCGLELLLYPRLRQVKEGCQVGDEICR